MIEGVGQGSHCVSSYAEKLSLLSLERTVEQRLPLGAGVFPSVLEGLGYLQGASLGLSHSLGVDRK